MNENTLYVLAYNDINILLHSTLFYSVRVNYETRTFAINFRNLHPIRINVIVVISKLCKTMRIYEIQKSIKKRNEKRYL